MENSTRKLKKNRNLIKAQNGMNCNLQVEGSGDTGQEQRQ